MAARSGVWIGQSGSLDMAPDRSVRSVAVALRPFAVAGVAKTQNG